MTGTNIERRATVNGEDFLQAHEVREWLEHVPDGAVAAKMKDFGNQRDPEVRLVGLVASWSETRPES